MNTMNVDRKRNLPSPYNPLSCKKSSPDILIATRLARARPRTRGRWSKREDQIQVVVDEALTLLRGKRIGEICDAKIWAAICRRVGPRSFACALRQFLDEAKTRGKLPEKPASAFQAYLNEVFPRPEKISRRDAEAQRAGGAR